MLSTVSRTEKPSLRTDECIIVVAFQEAIAVPVDRMDGFDVRDGYVVWLDADPFPVFVVLCVDREGAPHETGLEGQPGVAECCEGWSGDVTEVGVGGEIGKKIV